MRARMRPLLSNNNNRQDIGSLADDCDNTATNGSDFMSVDLGTAQPVLAKTINPTGCEEDAVELIPSVSSESTQLSDRGRLRLSRTLYRRGKLVWSEKKDGAKAIGFFEKAMEALSTASEIHTEDDCVLLASILTSLADLAVELDNHEDACKYFRSALDQHYKAFGKEAKNEVITKTLHR